MLEKPLIVGANGTMGRRYAAILRHLHITPICRDVLDPDPEPGSYDSVIIATPTNKHVNDVIWYGRYGVPILCEKPFSTDITEIRSFAERHPDIQLNLVNQYKSLDYHASEGITSYDYFNSGKDGLAFDCVSILALARGPVHLDSRSPVWSCWLNGAHVKIERMDNAYIQMIRTWLMGNLDTGIDYILEAHEKAAAWQRS